VEQQERTMDWKSSLLFFAAAAALALPGSAAQAATATATQRVTVIVQPMATLAVGSEMISLRRSTAPEAGEVYAAEGAVPVTVRARCGRGETVHLTVQAEGDLLSGADGIAISSLSWQANGAGFQAGRMSATAPQTVGVWGRSGQHEGSLRFRLRCDAPAAVGTYTVVLVYTLTAH
jgi:hypothetical protein